MTEMPTIHPICFYSLRNFCPNKAIFYIYCLDLKFNRLIGNTFFYSGMEYKIDNIYIFNMISKTISSFLVLIIIFLGFDLNHTSIHDKCGDNDFNYKESICNCETEECENPVCIFCASTDKKSFTGNSENETVKRLIKLFCNYVKNNLSASIIPSEKQIITSRSASSFTISLHIPTTVLRI